MGYLEGSLCTIGPKAGRKTVRATDAIDLLSGHKKALAGHERARQGVSTRHSANYAVDTGVVLLFFWCSSTNALVIPRPSTAGSLVRTPAMIAIRNT